MQITLDSNPSDAPCCIKIIADNGQDRLIQTDWDWPGIASTFGFTLRSVQKCDECGKISTGLHNQVVKFCKHCRKNVGSMCHHEMTDGTIDCACGVTAHDFIQSAGQYLDDNDGAQAEDPGYFDNA